MNGETKAGELSISGVQTAISLPIVGAGELYQAFDAVDLRAHTKQAR